MKSQTSYLYSSGGGGGVATGNGNGSGSNNIVYKNHTWSRNMNSNFLSPNEPCEMELYYLPESDRRELMEGYTENGCMSKYHEKNTEKRTNQGGLYNSNYSKPYLASYGGMPTPASIPPPPPPPTSQSLYSNPSKYSVFKNNKWDENYKYNKRSAFFLCSQPSTSERGERGERGDYYLPERDRKISSSHRPTTSHHPTTPHTPFSSPTLPPPPQHQHQHYSNYCNNCGRNGHGFYECKNPITSYGVIIFRYANHLITGKKERQYLMIRRRDTISYVDFLRGKYSISNRKYIKNLFKDMTEYEQDQIMTQSFEYLWCELWKNNEPNPYDKIRMSQDKWKKNISKGELVNTAPPTNTNTNEEKQEYDNQPFPPAPGDIYNSYDCGKMNTKDKFNILQKGLVFNQKKHFTIAELVGEIRKENQEMNIKPWKEPEWGFCKGRRNYKENDYDCAVREMEEETGYSKESMTAIKNINTFEEIFIGSNFKCYKHKYYLMHMTLENSLKTGVFEKTEVSCIKWAPITECLGLIRGYNIEKKRMIINVENALNNYTVFESR
jgi:8-oxo-dGTP pyrophosphatase MutT (NUDIX family)